MYEATEHLPESCVLVIFGASGDLTARKIVPALFNLTAEGRLPHRFHIVGYSRSDFPTDSFRKHMRVSLETHSRITPGEHPDALERLLENTIYCRGDYSSTSDLTALRKTLESLDKPSGSPQNRLFYFAVPPETAADLVSRLQESKLLERRAPEDAEKKGFHRVVMEKPFGHDLDSARALNAGLLKGLEENQIYRIDHYLGKETVQNIMVLRFANSIFEPVWNNRYVQNVHITVAESDGVGNRAKYFDSAGALRDVMQNHVLQLLALFAMEPPTGMNAASVRSEKAKLLGALSPLSDEELRCAVIRGQYSAGNVGGKKAVAYRSEKGIAPDSRTETFAAIRAYINNWRWSGVPFYLSTGKRLVRKLTEVAIEFKKVPHNLFAPYGSEDPAPNMLKIQVQPEERIALRIASKSPGLKMNLSAVDMELPYSSRFSSQSPEAYERLILDAIAGDPSLFASSEEIRLAWKYVMPIIEYWKNQPDPAFPNYQAGSWGPIEGKNFFREDVCYAELGKG